MFCLALSKVNKMFVFLDTLGLHVHQLGDVRDQCRSDRLGPHYNPYNVLANKYLTAF